MGYRWSSNRNAASNNNRQAQSRINDGDRAVNVNLNGTGDDAPNAWEAAGVIWNNNRTIRQVKFWNGSCDSNNLLVANGYFMANVRLQYTTDGTTWQEASKWVLTPAYPYISLSACNAYYTFSSTAPITARGIRIIGQVHTQRSYSWHAHVNEVEAY